MFAIHEMKKQDRKNKKEEKWIAKVNKKHQVIIQLSK